MLNIRGLPEASGTGRDEGLVAIRNAYKLLYRGGETLDEAKLEIAELAEEASEVKAFTEFFERSTRGPIR